MNDQYTFPDDLYEDDFFKLKKEELSIRKQNENLKTEIYKLKLTLDDATKNIFRLERELRRLRAKSVLSNAEDEQPDSDNEREKKYIMNLLNLL